MGRRPSLPPARCSDVTHRGSRVKADGTYVTAEGERRRYRCTPSVGKRHSFSLVVTAVGPAWLGGRSRRRVPGRATRPGRLCATARTASARSTPGSGTCAPPATARSHMRSPRRCPATTCTSARTSARTATSFEVCTVGRPRWRVGIPGPRASSRAGWSSSPAVPRTPRSAGGHYALVVLLLGLRRRPSSIPSLIQRSSPSSSPRLRRTRSRGPGSRAAARPGLR